MKTNKPSKQTGFTLLEVLIVLLLISFIVGLVAPALPKLYDRLKFNLEKKEVIRQVEGMGYKAYLNSQNYSFKQQGANAEVNAFLQIPEGWRVLAEKTIELKANGICLGGVVQLSYRSFKQKYNLKAPYCELVAIKQ